MIHLSDLVTIWQHRSRSNLAHDLAYCLATPHIAVEGTCCHGPHLHAILRIISRGVSG